MCPVLTVNTIPVENPRGGSRFYQLNVGAIGIPPWTDQRIKRHAEGARQSQPRVIRQRRGNQPFRVRGFRRDALDYRRIRVISQHLKLAVKTQARSEVN